MTSTFNLTTLEAISYVIGIAVGLATIVALIVRYYYKAKIENILQKPGIITQARQENINLNQNKSRLEKIAYGMKDHYDTAAKIVEYASDEIFLMQRSSTLLLGPEEGWNEERKFYNALFNKLQNGVEIRHIVSLEGLIDHLRRPGSKFPGIKEAMNSLPIENGVVVLKGPAGSFPVKVVPTRFKDEYTKLDRQARTLVIKLKDGSYKAGIVIDLGVTQCHFIMSGPYIREFYRACRDLYNECPVLAWEELCLKLNPWISPKPCKS
jgi:hypothetical protein